MKMDYPIISVIITPTDKLVNGSNGKSLKYVYDGKIFTKKGVRLIYTHHSEHQVIHVYFKGRKLPPIMGSLEHNYLNIDGFSHFFKVYATKDIAEWCLCNRDITQPLFEKYGFDVTATAHNAYMDLLGACTDEKRGLLLADLFGQCEKEAG